MPPIRVAIIVFDDVEILGFAGPMEVFTIAAQPPFTTARPPFPLGASYRVPPPGSGRMAFDVAILSQSQTIRTSHGRGCAIARNIDLFSPEGQDDKWDIVVIPGGVGTRLQMENLHLLDWISRFARSYRGRRKTILSVCTGTLLLAKAAILDGMRVTTHSSAREMLQTIIEEGGGMAEVVEDRVVYEVLRGSGGEDLGVDVVTTGGVSSGIDGALYVVKKLVGVDIARGAADWIEYDWKDVYV
ncbi:class I glutamine amidotransferase-like protein [Choiromyces venosus 120613-1]|uniref:Class I glutamine amidotransferase-like protein n=1 Tax=Choiromyces venosus 120613-1 TaxID=1336337 RepID=A0A3N4JBH5_9PEZI|nr:class I glutamine amidotransferase-like protein [Choiromyces venosus 120613-1]